mgnify:CR=1 FL=1
MSHFSTEQEEFWAGQFGSEYIGRNQGDELIASNINFFSKALRNAQGMQSCIEFGPNIGMNLRALKLLYPGLQLYGIEINPDAVKYLAKVIPPEHIYHKSILEFQPDRVWDLVLIKGVLIHLNPEMLTQVYDKLCCATNRYLLVAEYYNPSPVAIPYRGHENRLFKRDFAGEILDKHPEMKLVDYGFAYHRDPDFPQDDISWFLLEKSDL